MSRGENIRLHLPVSTHTCTVSRKKKKEALALFCNIASSHSCFSTFFGFRRRCETFRMIFLSTTEGEGPGWVERSLSVPIPVCAPGMFVGVVCSTEKYNKWGGGPKCFSCFCYLWGVLYFLQLSLCFEWCSVFHTNVSQGPQGPDGPAGESGPEGTKVNQHTALLENIPACMWELIFEGFHGINHKSSLFTA